MFPVIYKENPNHPLVKAISIEEFDKSLIKQLYNDLNIIYGKNIIRGKVELYYFLN
jgi:hypothetical protein